MDTGIENPIRALRKRLGLSQGQLAVTLGVPFEAIQRSEGGNGGDHLPRRVVEALVAAGADAEELQQQYSTWRAAQRQAGRQALQVALR